jgi:hypothetical protein
LNNRQLDHPAAKNMKGNIMQVEKTDTQRLDEIRGFLKNLNTWAGKPFFEPAIITEHPDYTVVVAPAPVEPDIEPPTVYSIENSELLKLSRYLDQYDAGDEIFDDFECRGASLMNMNMDADLERDCMFWDLFFTLTAKQKGHVLDLKIQPLGDYFLERASCSNG